MARKTRAFLIAALLTLGIDQATKIWAIQVLAPMRPNVISVIPGYFELEYAENTGAAFSFLANHSAGPWILLLVGAIAVAVIVVMLRRTDPASAKLGAVYGLLAGGAVGNLVDRARLGHVVDFVLWRVGEHRWPNFNVADAALLLGVVGLLVWNRPTAHVEHGATRPA